MPKVFITGIALFLLLAAAGYGIATLQARSIPWDCADWQAFAHDDRTTAILESLAANRGKTLYCGVDQSDTFTKAETWEAGKDRNERDDTVYQGEQGRFRGFIAAQEGWLTDGESGITGMSIDRIFEFPREEKKRRRYKNQYLRNVIPDRPEGAQTSMNWVWSDFGPEASSTTSQVAAQTAAEGVYVAPTGAELRRQALTNNVWLDNTDTGMNANELCVSRGYQRAANVDPYLNLTGFNYSNRSSGGTYYSRAQRGILFRGGADCVRRVRR